MLQCSNCGFSVNELMKFALTQNRCPSCGGNLFSNKDMNLISLIQSKISSQRFASRLTQELIYDLSLFIFNELKVGDFSQYIEKNKKTTQAPGKEEVGYKEELNDIDDIRKEVEAEFQEHLSVLSNEDESEFEDDDNDDLNNEDDVDVLSKSEKLKRLRQSQIIQNPNLGKSISTNISGSKKTGPRVNRST